MSNEPTGNRAGNWGRIAVFDLETTGVDTDTARIVSACIAVLDTEGAVVARWDWLADPGIEIPDGAAAVHGITTERARALGRPAAEVVAEIAQTLRVVFGLGMPVVVYNAPYDLTLLDRECRRHHLAPLAEPTPVIDPLVIDKAVDRYRKGKRTLEVTSLLYGVALDDAHDAGSDAIAAGRVAQALLRAYPDDLDVSLADLHGRQQVWYAEQAASFADYIRRTKGDDGYVADTSWPLRPIEHETSVVDTQPIPAPTPRASLVVPRFDFETGALELEGGGLVPLLELEALGVISHPAPPVHETGRHALTELPAPRAPQPEPLQLPIDLTPDSVEDDSTESPDQADSAEQAGSAEQTDSAEQTTPEQLDSSERADLDPSPTSDAGPTSQPVTATEPPAPAPASFSPVYAAAPPPRRQTVLRVAAAIITDPAGRTLLVRKSGTTAFMQAGGKIEPGESAVDALSRELVEEIGLELDLGATEYLGSFRAVAANEPNTVIRAEVFALRTELDLSPAGEIEELLWIDTDDPAGVELAPLTRDTVLPLWVSRRSALF